MRRVRVTVEVTPNDGPVAVEVYELDPRNCHLENATLAEHGYPSRFTELGYDMSRLVHARGHLTIRGLMLGPAPISPEMGAYAAGLYRGDRDITWAGLAEMLRDRGVGDYDPLALRAAADAFAREAFDAALLADWQERLAKEP